VQLLIVAATLATGALADEPELVLTFRVRPGVKPETLRQLAELAEPTRVTIESPTTVQKLLRENYGNSIPAIEELVARYNNGTTKATVVGPGKKKREFVLPAAPVWRFEEKAFVGRSANTLQEVLLKMGVAGPKTRSKLEQVNNTTIEKLEELSAGQDFKLPYALPLVSFRVRKEHLQDAKKIVETIRKSDPAVQSATVARPMKVIGSWLDGAQALPGCAIAGPTPTSEPPVVSKPLLATLPSVSVIVAVLDSGIPIDDTRFHLWTNPHEQVGDDDHDGNHLGGDVYGYDFVNKTGFPADDLKEFHGTHVAGIATQRVADLATQQEIDKHVQLLALKVVDKYENIMPAAVGSAIWYASNRKARVVNMSFSGEFDFGIMSDMRNAADLLFVVAAGNAHDGSGPWDVDDQPIYPAKHTADMPNILAVAAADRLPGRACFSNYGKTRIDLAAPGMSINSTVGGNATERMSGSSQAAPLVSYVAALLSTSLNTPVEIKNRIIDTVDVLQDLKGQVASDGILNAEKALMFRTDVVQKSGRLIAGRITDPLTIRTGDGQTFPIREVRKIVPNYDTDLAKAFRVTVDSDGARRTFATSLSFDHVTIQTPAGIQTIPVYEIRDIVPVAQLH